MANCKNCGCPVTVPYRSLWAQTGPWLAVMVAATLAILGLEILAMGLY